MWILHHSLDCHAQGCSSATEGVVHVLWQMNHLLQFLSNPGHHTNILPKDFICDIPMWMSCKCSNILWCNEGDTTTLFLHNRQPYCADSSSSLNQYGLSLSQSHESGQPCNTNCSTWDNSGLWLVSLFVSVACTREESKLSINNTISGGSGTVVRTVVNGRRLSASH